MAVGTRRQERGGTSTSCPPSYWFINVSRGGRAGSGFKLHVENLQSLSLALGEHTTAPVVSIGVSVDYEPFTTVNVSSGTNVIFSHRSNASLKPRTIVRINVEGWQNNRINLERIVLNEVRKNLTSSILLWVLSLSSFRALNYFHTPRQSWASSS